MPNATRTIGSRDRFVMLIAELVINTLFLYLPIFLVLIVLLYFNIVTFYAFTKCCIFFSLVTYLHKDIAGGRSLGKRFLGYAVVKENDGNAPRMATCFLRNSTFLIFPAELLFGLFSPDQKMTDYFTHTKIIKVPQEKNSLTSFYRDLKNTSYNNETREAIGLTLLVFMLVLFIK